MPRPELSVAEIIDALAQQKAPLMTRETHDGVRAAIADIIAGRSLREVNLADLQRGAQESLRQRDIARMEREDSAAVGMWQRAFREDVRTIPHFVDQILRAGDVFPVDPSRGKYDSPVVNLEPLITQDANGKDVPLQFPTKSNGRWDHNAPAFGGNVTVLGFSQDAKNALVRYASPPDDGATRRESAPTGTQYFMPVFALPAMKELFDREQQFRRVLREIIERINRGEGRQEARIDSSFHFEQLNRQEEGVVMAGDYVSLYDYKGHSSMEVCVMNTHAVVPHERVRKHTVAGREKLVFRHRVDWDTVQLSHGLARIQGFTDDGRMALVEYRGNSHTDDPKRDQSLCGTQFFVGVRPMSKMEAGDDWVEILWGQDITERPRVPFMGDLTIYDPRSINDE